MQRIIDLAERLLKYMGLVRQYTDDDVINAENDDALRTHSSAVVNLHESIERRLQGNEALRRSITIAKDRTNSFGEFERQVKAMRNRE